MGAYDVDETGVSVLAGLPVTGAAVVPDGVGVEDLVAVDRALCLLHHGSMETIGDAWQALVSEVAERGLALAGTAREVYLATPLDDPAAWVTELQLPVSSDPA